MRLRLSFYMADLIAVGGNDSDWWFCEMFVYPTNVWEICIMCLWSWPRLYCVVKTIVWIYILNGCLNAGSPRGRWFSRAFWKRCTYWTWSLFQLWSWRPLGSRLQSWWLEKQMLLMWGTWSHRKKLPEQSKEPQVIFLRRNHSIPYNYTLWGFSSYVFGLSYDLWFVKGCQATFFQFWKQLKKF